MSEPATGELPLYHLAGLPCSKRAEQPPHGPPRVLSAFNYVTTTRGGGDLETLVFNNFDGKRTQTTCRMCPECQLLSLLPDWQAAVAQAVLDFDAQLARQAEEQARWDKQRRRDHLRLQMVATTISAEIPGLGLIEEQSTCGHLRQAFRGRLLACATPQCREGIEHRDLIEPDIDFGAQPATYLGGDVDFMRPVSVQPVFWDRHRYLLDERRALARLTHQGEPTSFWFWRRR